MLIFSIAANTLVFGEDTVVLPQNDSIILEQDNYFFPDLNDTVDLIRGAPRSRSAIDTRIDYKAKDSIFFDLRRNTVHLFEKSRIDYGDIELTAAKIEVYFDRDEISAFPKHDSLGKEIDRPFFKDSRQEFEARELTYNLNTGKARIKNIVTREDDMLIHGDRVKKMPDNTAFVQRARFTTCDLEHPHYFIAARRAKIIPNDKVVTGGAMLFLNDVPTPLAVPFGLFPNTNKHSSGILVPSYGESTNPEQGFFLRNGGFYWGINDHFDWRITGDIYSRGEWQVRNAWRYVKRYKFNGGISFDAGMVPSGERGTERFSLTRSLRVGWNHSQDPRANQNSSFSASVNYFNSASQRYSLQLADHFNNQSNSNIAYQIRIANRFKIEATARLDYNMDTGNISTTLPSVNFSMNPIYPFRSKVRRGNPKWYESFKMNYSMSAVNRASGNDSSFWNQEMLDNMVHGVRHNIPMDLNIKILNGRLNWNHSVQYAAQWHFKATHRNLEIDTAFIPVFDPSTNELLYDSVVINRTVVFEDERGFFHTHNYGYSTSISTQLFGMLQFRRGPLKAFRHVASPSIGFSISPDFFNKASGFRYHENVREDRDPVRYNLYDGSPFRPAGGGRSGSINFSLGNNFEMKVRDRKDTVRGERKVKLVDRLSLSTSYNIAADSLNWAPISLTASTTLFGRLQITYNARFSLYTRERDTNGHLTNRTINKFIWQDPGRRFLLRESESMGTGFSWSLSSKKQDENSQQTIPGTGEIFERAAAFAPQWSISVNYNINYNSNFRPGYHANDIWGRPVIDWIFSDYDRRIQQTLTASGSLNITDKWAITIHGLGWDFTRKKLTSTTFNIARDLCCWEMRFSWTPFGDLKQWSFGINMKSSMLRDVLKYDRARTHREFDNYF